MNFIETKCQIFSFTDIFLTVALKLGKGMPNGSKIAITAEMRVTAQKKKSWVKVSPEVGWNWQLIGMLIISVRPCLPVGHIGLTTISSPGWVLRLLAQACQIQNRYEHKCYPKKWAQLLNSSFHTFSMSDVGSHPFFHILEMLVEDHWSHDEVPYFIWISPLDRCTSSTTTVISRRFYPR